MNMTDQARKAEYFRALHVAGKPLVLFNIWDAGSAKTVAAAGAKAIATASWSVAHANGFSDGEQMPLAFGHRKSAQDRRSDGLAGDDRSGKRLW
jgi:2-methylisocitrate lyase-like PEP mutase family enzyme